jgi:flavoprotein hydroxylase
MNPRRDPDVLVVGYGPVGQVTAILLARHGWHVTVLERWPQAYPMPRAVSFDGESARILATTGIAGEMSEFAEPSRDYRWLNGSGDVLFHVDVEEHGRSGWPDSTSVYQPSLEAALAARAEKLANVRVLRGHRVMNLVDHGDHVELLAETEDGRQSVFQAAWVVGCDGANSFVRTAIDGTMTDLGFRNDWLTCDVSLHEPREFSPNNLQVCDPGRPRTAVSAGPGHRRWEFMRLPDEPAAEFGTTENVWRLLELFDIHPENADLERHSVYTFQARYADQWRKGRVLLAGDAAHLMPPFAGQGMCSGFRDAANLVWKLDLVLRGLADELLLDTYTTERRAHVQHAISISVHLGRVICQTDPAAARDRDTVMLASRERASSAAPSAVRNLTDGLLHRDSKGAPMLPAGQLAPQGCVTHGGRGGMFDEVFGTGFVLLSTEPATEILAAGGIALLSGIGTTFVHLGSPDSSSTVDDDGTYLRLLAASDAVAVLVRPDFYVFGAARDRAGLAALVADLCEQLSANERYDAAAS